MLCLGVQSSSLMSCRGRSSKHGFLALPLALEGATCLRERIESRSRRATIPAIAAAEVAKSATKSAYLSRRGRTSEGSTVVLGNHRHSVRLPPCAAASTRRLSKSAVARGAASEARRWHPRGRISRPAWSDRGMALSQRDFILGRSPRSAGQSADGNLSWPRFSSHWSADGETTNTCDVRIGTGIYVSSGSIGKPVVSISSSRGHAD